MTDKRRQIIRISLMVLLCLLCMAATGIITFFIATKENESKIFIETNGPKELTIEYGTPYADEGATAVGISRTEGAKRLAVLKDGNVDTQKIGNYNLTYYVMYGNRIYSDTRLVRVVDTIKPVITVAYADDIQSWYTGPREYLVSATDNCDGDITDKLVYENDGGKIFYKVTDKSGNTAQIILKEDPVIQPPEIVFPENTQTMTFFEGDEIRIPSPTAIDGNNNDVSQYIKVSGEIDSNTPGTYTLEYNITNILGETVKATRTVIIERKTNSETIINPNKVIKLLLDQHTGQPSQKIVQMLKKYNVPAVFMYDIEDNQITENTLPILDYSVGLIVNITKYRLNHQTDRNNLIYDLEKINRDYSAQASKRIHLIHYRYSEEAESYLDGEIVKALKQDLTNSNYKYIDWTIGIPNDNKTASSDLIENAIAQITDKSCNTIMADTKYITAAHLEKLILWGIKNGYTFVAEE